ncbi:MAG: DUF4406 domain-containing protein [Eubacteriaceae bacterium]|nr:DUF4406 domain-containing protein [Eubacteriaceae bacterium]
MDKSKRGYISGAIAGQEEFVTDFQLADIRISKTGIETINPVAVSNNLPSLTWEEYIKIDLALLDCCSDIYMLPTWIGSKGARRELAYALLAGIKVHFIGETCDIAEAKATAGKIRTWRDRWGDQDVEDVSRCLPWI